MKSLLLIVAGLGSHGIALAIPGEQWLLSIVGGILVGVAILQVGLLSKRRSRLSAEAAEREHDEGIERILDSSNTKYWRVISPKSTAS